MPISPRRALASLISPLALAALAALTACGEALPPAPPPVATIPVYPGPPAPHVAAGSAAPGTPAAAFAALRDRILDDWLRDDPSFGRELGLHEYDGKLGDHSAQAIQARLDRLAKDRALLAAIDDKALSPDDALDLGLLRRQIDLTLFQEGELESWRRFPHYYRDIFDVDAYLVRDYAPLEERAQKLLLQEKAALREAPHIQKNLKSPLARSIAATGVKIYKGYAEYFRGDVLTLTKGVGDQAFQDDLKKTSLALADEALKIASFLEAEAKKGDDSHVLGKARFEKLLAVQEGLQTPLPELLATGEKDLAENKKRYEALVKKVKVTKPKPASLFAEATKVMNAARAFIVDKKLVTIPTDDQAVAKETPPFMRWNAAFLNPPGNFEQKAKTAFYYITLPDPTWKKKEQEEYVMSYGSLLSTTVHEVYPGHFLQGQWERRAPTRVQKMFGAYSFIEGWAHYVEQMIVDEGFGADDPQSRLGQLSDALLRDCRFVVAIGVHAQGMSLAAAEKRFVTDCKQDKATAREQAARAAFDPGFFAYTLGKLQILALREEAKLALGDKFSLQRFHDALLSHGSPPVALIKDRVLADLKASAGK
ncbi:MAG: DUF885 domain-containing protein [Byssovorax sp.]